MSPNLIISNRQTGPDRPRTRTATRTAIVCASIVCAFLLTTSLAACGSDSSSTSSRSKLTGLTRTDPIDVSSVTLPDITDGATSSTRTMVATSGRLLIVYFGYTNCPDVCPTTLTDLKLAYAMAGSDVSDKVDTVFVTVDFARDTAQKLNDYIASFLPGMHALRATTTEQLEAAKAAFGVQSSVITKPDGMVDVTHSAVTYVIDSTGRIICEWPFGTHREAIAHDLEILTAGL